MRSTVSSLVEKMSLRPTFDLLSDLLSECPGNPALTYFGTF